MYIFIYLCVLVVVGNYQTTVQKLQRLDIEKGARELERFCEEREIG